MANNNGYTVDASAERAFMRKENYYAKRTYGKGLTENQIRYARGWSLGADYAQAVTKNGNDLEKGHKDEYILKIKKDTRRSINNEGFLRGFNSFMGIFKKGR
jgi:hypothetical protein